MYEITVWKQFCKLQCKTQISVFHLVKMIVFAQVCHQVESIQCIAVVVVTARNVDAFVVVELIRSQKQRVVGAYKLTLIVIWLDRFLTGCSVEN